MRKLTLEKLKECSTVVFAESFVWSVCITWKKLYQRTVVLYVGNRRKSVADCAVIGFEVSWGEIKKVVKINRSTY